MSRETPLIQLALASFCLLNIREALFTLFAISDNSLSIWRETGLPSANVSMASTIGSVFWMILRFEK